MKIFTSSLVLCISVFAISCSFGSGGSSDSGGSNSELSNTDLLTPTTTGTTVPVTTTTLPVETRAGETTIFGEDNNTFDEDINTFGEDTDEEAITSLIPPTPIVPPTPTIDPNIVEPIPSELSDNARLAILDYSVQDDSNAILDTELSWITQYWVDYFSPNNYDYFIQVPPEATAIAFTPTTQDEGATISLEFVAPSAFYVIVDELASGTTSQKFDISYTDPTPFSKVDVSEAIFKALIKVTAENGAIRTYTFVLLKPTNTIPPPHLG